MGLNRTRSLWWRWSWRDLRAHWVAVVTIAMVIALGTGLFAGLGSTSKWRQLAYDGSFAQLSLHDVRISLTEGTFAPEGSLIAALADVGGASDGGPPVTAARERLVIGTQVDTSTELVSGRLIGADLSTTTAPDGLWLGDGRLPTADATPPEVVLETKFAEYYDVQVGDLLAIGGGQPVRVTGLGMAPEEFWVRGPQGSFLGHVDLATIYTTLDDAQRLSGRTGEVNDLLVSLAGDQSVEMTPIDAEADRRSTALQLLATVTGSAAVSAMATTGAESYAATILYDDIETDQAIFSAISLLILGAAALAAFNLISRIVDTQRHEVGIGLALGVSRLKLGLRPVLVGLQVGVIGTLGGIGVGVVVGSLMDDLLQRFTPLPYSPTPFQIAVYAQGAILGVIPPVVAAVAAVWRIVRVEPVDALRTGHLTSRGRLGSWANRIGLPGNSIAQMPVRNLLRAPRRTLFTALGVGAAITALVGVLGLLDSFEATVNEGVAEVTSGDPDRITVTLDTFYPLDHPVITDLLGLDQVGAATTGLRLGGEVSRADTTNGAGAAPTGTADGAGEDRGFEVLLEIIELDNPVWSPRLTASSEHPGDGVILAGKAARDLGVGIGDVIRLRHPAVTAAGPSLTVSEVEVTGIHPAPLRTLTYLGEGFAERFGLAGFANSAQIIPAEGVGRDRLQRAVFVLDGVTSAQPVARVGEVFEQAIDEFVSILYVAAGAVLLLALLIAFNSSRIALEERRREHATMMAFGIPVRTVVRTVVAEAVVVGILATIIGIVAGLVSVRWILDSLVGTSFPEFSISLSLSATTVMLATVVGVVAVALAPLLLIGRLRAMDLPSTLRVLE